jgi:hypothetical protein
MNAGTGDSVPRLEGFSCYGHRSEVIPSTLERLAQRQTPRRDRRRLNDGRLALASGSLAAAAKQSSEGASGPTRQLSGVISPTMIETRDGTRLHFRDWGAGRPIVFAERYAHRHYLLDLITSSVFPKQSSTDRQFGHLLPALVCRKRSNDCLQIGTVDALLCPRS